MKLIIANWKATKGLDTVREWIHTFGDAFIGTWKNPRDIRVVICPPVLYLEEVFLGLQEFGFPFDVTVGAQDVSPYPDGTYTGAVTARMFKGFSVTHVIVGHSERRRWFHETPQDVAMKVDQALQHSIQPIVSVDRENFRTQLTQFDDEPLRRMIIMYEPPEAISTISGSIGSGKSADISDIDEMVTTLHRLAPETPILYGGSVKSANARTFLSHPNLAGVVVGTASMDAQEFVNILNAA